MATLYICSGVFVERNHPRISQGRAEEVEKKLPTAACGKAGVREESDLKLEPMWTCLCLAWSLRGGYKSANEPSRQILEMHHHKSGFAPGVDQFVHRSRRRYRLVVSP